jgi:hypothetical protein
MSNHVVLEHFTCDDISLHDALQLKLGCPQKATNYTVFFHLADTVIYIHNYNVYLYSNYYSTCPHVGFELTTLVHGTQHFLLCHHVCVND